MRYKHQHAQIVEVCKTAITLSQVELALGTSTPNGSLRRYIRHHEIPMPQYQGQKAASRMSQKSRMNLTEADLCENSLVSTGGIKRFLLRNGLKQEACEICGWAESRADGKIPVQLHHKNGDSSDHRLCNLQMLCPNHHSLTDNFAGKNKHNKGRRLLHQRKLDHGRTSR
jgi:hypothetical protein